MMEVCPIVKIGRLLLGWLYIIYGLEETISFSIVTRLTEILCFALSARLEKFWEWSGVEEIQENVAAG